jgi:hypothetical protein
MTLNLPSVFLGLANRVSAGFGAPFYDGLILGEATPGYTNDDGIWVPGTDGTPRPCRVQLDDATEFMKTNEGFADGEVQFVILTASLDGGLDTSATVTIPAGPRAGTWLVSDISIDPANIGFVGKGKRK